MHVLSQFPLGLAVTLAVTLLGLCWRFLVVPHLRSARVAQALGGLGRYTTQIAQRVVASLPNGATLASVSPDVLRGLIHEAVQGGEAVAPHILAGLMLVHSRGEALALILSDVTQVLSQMASSRLPLPLPPAPAALPPAGSPPATPVGQASAAPAPAAPPATAAARVWLPELAAEDIYVRTRGPLGLFIQPGLAVLGVLLLAALCFGGCTAIPVPVDGGAPAPSWVPGAVISLTVADGALVAAEATEASTGFTGTDLADYDAVLRVCVSGDQVALGHVQNGASACQLHADAAALVTDFDQIAGICSRHGTPVPTSILTGAGRLVSVLTTVLPPCLDPDAGVSTAAGNPLAGMSNAALAAHLRSTFAGYALPVPAHAEDR